MKSLAAVPFGSYGISRVETSLVKSTGAELEESWCLKGAAFIEQAQQLRLLLAQSGSSRCFAGEPGLLLVLRVALLACCTTGLAARPCADRRSGSCMSCGFAVRHQKRTAQHGRTCGQGAGKLRVALPVMYSSSSAFVKVK